MVNAAHWLIGVEGLALLRMWLVGDRRRADERVREIAAFAASPPTLELDAPEETVVSGYGRWAPTYDATPNPLIRAEEPVVHAMIDALPAGTALDAACGTGRHARHLHARGHHVVGVDASPAMLEQARRALPDVEFRVGDLTALPVDTAGVDLVVCALALSHCPDLGPPIRELARVVRPGSRLVISDFHPMMASLGGSAFFVAKDGRGGHVKSYCHWHGAYLAAFAAADLRILRCVEVPNGEEEGLILSGGMMHLAPDAFRDGLLGLPQALVWELARC